jgi:hypothetical protein
MTGTAATGTTTDIMIVDTMVAALTEEDLMVVMVMGHMAKAGEGLTVTSPVQLL